MGGQPVRRRRVPLGKVEAMASSVAGIDGCRHGWVVVTVALDGERTTTVERVTQLDGVMARLDCGDLDAAGIDIPIGLPDAGPRRCDVEARRMIGPRRSSVFPAPLRGLLGATTYEDAAARSRALSGKSVSRQAFNILSKVAEIDLLMAPERQHYVVEVHPEVSFTALNRAPMVHPKKEAAGRAERLAALRPVFPDVDVHAGVAIPGAGADDVIDAFAVAWSARRWLARTHVQLGGDTDRCGLRMEIVA
jgi:predicted RNase H-like nuclease